MEKRKSSETVSSWRWCPTPKTTEIIGRAWDPSILLFASTPQQPHQFCFSFPSFPFIVAHSPSPPPITSFSFLAPLSLLFVVSAVVCFPSCHISPFFLSIRLSFLSFLCLHTTSLSRKQHTPPTPTHPHTVPSTPSLCLSFSTSNHRASFLHQQITTTDDHPFSPFFSLTNSARLTRTCVPGHKKCSFESIPISLFFATHHPHVTFPLSGNHLWKHKRHYSISEHFSSHPASIFDNLVFNSFTPTHTPPTAHSRCPKTPNNAP